ncbi:sterol desaturase/sphingolipid hydroxylase (fatty acid hydroxylase superfamily) [Pelomonas aquatica]|uniref:Sterol desaturase/sphingolipid hydroxylase (Fatty acid hydroxylase superfamily) n=1 Tax=Pelomonas aquatica TaxID=431058 RepID=A0ABU1ZE60_9BURK|nr:sterol desaturase family protein [Pelomonas aquatica]MDR7298908.1 sterol desaturase/sphingolipid hydroxylase (fatty acid hydroxylase superfamily) [Pelomonas aquatica]
MSQVWQQWQALAASLPHKALGLAAWLLAMAVVFGLLERRFPVRRQRFLRENMAQDVGYYFLGGLLPPFLTVAATAALAWFVSGLVPASFYAWVASLPFAVRVGAMVLLGDVAFYWAHRWSHENEWLWRLHAVHHSPTELDWLVNTRAHPLDLVFARAVSAMPIVVLGVRQGNDGLDAAVAVYLTLTTLWAFFVHTNLKWRLGWLEQLIVTPAFHHWHHANMAGTLNKNYASLFPWIDRVFGTYHLPAQQFPLSYGADRELPETLGKQLVSPFRRRLG